MGGVLNDLWDLHRPELCEDNQQQRQNLPTRVTFVDADKEDNQRRERISSVTSSSIQKKWWVRATMWQLILYELVFIPFHHRWQEDLLFPDHVLANFIMKWHRNSHCIQDASKFEDIPSDEDDCDRLSSSVPNQRLLKQLLKQTKCVILLLSPIMR